MLNNQSISIFSQLGSDLGNFSCIDRLSNSGGLLDSSLVPGESSFFSLVFQLFDELLFSPSDLGREISQSTELTERSQFNTSHGIWDVLFLGSVIRGGDSFENFKSAQSSSSNCSLVGKHSSNTSPEDSWRSSVMHESSSRIGQQSLSQELSKFSFVSEERSSDVDTFSSNNNNSLT